MTGSASVVSTVPTTDSAPVSPTNIANTAAEPIGGAAACSTSTRCSSAPAPTSEVAPQTSSGDPTSNHDPSHSDDAGARATRASAPQSSLSKAPVRVPTTAASTSGRISAASPGKTIPTNTPSGSAQRACRPTQASGASGDIGALAVARAR